MDTSTGEIKEFDSDRELKLAMQSGNWEQLGRKPKPNCRFCHGQGHNGYNLSLGKYVPCRCTKPKK